MKAKLSWFILVLAGCLFILLAIKSCVQKTAEETTAGVKKVFTDFAQMQPEIVINQTVVHQQSSPIAQLALIQKESFQRYTWSHEWMRSTKRIEISGTYVAKAGFDLRERFVVTLLENPGEVRVELPRAKLLSMEQKGNLVFQDESGWFNRLSSEDRESALNQARESARQEILKSGIIQEAEESAVKQLQELASKQGIKIELSLSKPKP
jgi:hypothetical protein